jgi:hypothetical protein
MCQSMNGTAWLRFFVSCNQEVAVESRLRRKLFRKRGFILASFRIPQVNTGIVP